MKEAWRRKIKKFLRLPDESQEALEGDVIIPTQYEFTEEDLRGVVRKNPIINPGKNKPVNTEGEAITPYEYELTDEMIRGSRAVRPVLPSHRDEPNDPNTINIDPSDFTIE